MIYHNKTPMQLEAINKFIDSIDDVINREAALIIWDYIPLIVASGNTIILPDVYTLLPECALCTLKAVPGNADNTPIVISMSTKHDNKHGKQISIMTIYSNDYDMIMKDPNGYIDHMLWDSKKS